MKKLNFQITDEYIGLSTEEKPTENVPDGSTFAEVDTGVSYMFYDGEWYEQ